jgi:hypothetical protein
MTSMEKGNRQSLSIGGVRANNHENLYSRKIEEHFKVFIGFKSQLLADFKIERQLNELTN